tara:strand:- start:1518 stop:1907 length:390 start_codon:yes stop_codon:yes gene_type:complete
MTRFYDGCLAEVGLRGTQYIILLFLSRRGAVTMAELAEALVMDRTTTGHNLKPLERGGFIEVRVCASDRRARVISLTQRGVLKVDEGRAAWTRAQDKFEQSFGSGKARDMRQVMDEVAHVDFDNQALGS